jgi:glucose-6-phosphate isomerase
MEIDLQSVCGLAVSFDPDRCDLIFGEGLNSPSYCVRKMRDLDAVWANKVEGDDQVIYRYTGGLNLKEDASIWADANVIYGIVMFEPGVFGGEYVKSSGQYHPPTGPTNQATPEIYTVLSGTGHFLLQKAAPPYDKIEDVVMVEVEEGETFVVPPDYGHLQINPSSQPLVFSYAVMDNMKGVYDPFKKRQGAAFYEMADSQNRFKRNTNYDEGLQLRVVRATDLCQLPSLNENVTYQLIRDNLSELKFLTDPTVFPESAAL